MKKTVILNITTCLVFLILFLLVSCSEEAHTGPQLPSSPESSESETVTSTPDIVIPSVPVNPEANALSPNIVEIRWLDNSNNEDGFKIYRGTTLVGTVPTDHNIFQDTGLQPNSSYRYAIRAYNQAGESSIASCNVTTPGPPTAPSNLNASVVSHKEIQLTWVDNSDDEAGFKIYRDQYLIAEINADVNSYSDNNLQPATSYEYSIVAYNQYGDSTPCKITIKTRNPPITIHLDRIGVYDNRESILRGIGDVYVIIGIADGSNSIEMKLPLGQNQTYSLDKGETITLNETVYLTTEVTDNLQIMFIGYESDGGSFEQIAYEAMGMAVDYYTGGIAIGLSEAFNISLTDIIGSLLGEEDDFLGQYELKCDKNNNWGIGQYNDIVLQDERGADCLRLWFTVSSY